MRGYTYPAILLYSDIVVVSFMHLTAYILNRKIWEIYAVKYAHQYIADIIRVPTRPIYVNIKFPSGVKSSNYLMKINTVHVIQMLKLKHHKMTRVWTKCPNSSAINVATKETL